MKQLRVLFIFILLVIGDPMTANKIPWTRYASNPLFGGIGANASYESVVLFENGVFRMWYTRGWGDDFAMNYATSDDGLTWSQHGIVLGDGGSGYADDVCRPMIIKVAGVYHLYFASNGAQNADLMHATSPDGIIWTTPIIVIAHNAKAWSAGWANSFVWKEGTTWYMVLEGVPQASAWAITALTSSDGLSWSFLTEGFLTTLNPVNGGFAYGGPYLTKRNGVYYIWYHASRTVGQNIPTDLYYASSTDLLTWTIANNGQPFLVHSGQFEVEQLGDAWIVEALGKTYLYFEGADNQAPASYMEVAIVQGSLEDWLDGFVYHRGTSVRGIVL